MKQLSGRASAPVSAPAETCMKVLADVERYPDWHPDVVRSVEVVERDPDGQATKAKTTLHVSAGPVTRDFNLTLTITVQPDTVRLERVPHEPSDEERFEVDWRVREGSQRTIEVELGAALPVPRFLPVGGIGDSLAQGFVGAAVAEIARSG
jgi:ribosome-associated toxin RatA of RatAB toxin-antitoxin module